MKKGLAGFCLERRLKKEKGKTSKRKGRAEVSVCVRREESSRELLGSHFPFFFSLSVGKLACTCITSSFFLFVF